MRQNPPKISDKDIRWIIQVSGAHERTVYRRIIGLPVRGRHLGARIDRALAMWLDGPSKSPPALVEKKSTRGLPLAEPLGDQKQRARSHE